MRSLTGFEFVSKSIDVFRFLDNWRINHVWLKYIFYQMNKRSQNSDE